MTEGHPQRNILQCYTALSLLREDWTRALILSPTLDLAGSALATASTIAGALCLSVEADDRTLRQALRDGACDFVVNSPDEALRALKNEARKGRPLSVGLSGVASVVIPELLERGVLPQLIVRIGPEPTPAADQLQAEDLPWLSLENEALLPIMARFTEAQGVALRSFTASNAAELSLFDQEVLRVLPGADAVRRVWMTAAPRLLPRSERLHRVLWLSTEEFGHVQRTLGGIAWEGTS